MKSRITIEVDFDNGNQPVIQIIQQQSTDVRDSLVQSFLQSLAHTSRWARFIYLGNRVVDPNEPPCHRWHIQPIVPSEIESEIKLMQSVSGLQRPYECNIHNNSTGFRKFLDEKEIEWRPNEHYTKIINPIVDTFILGQQYAEYKIKNEG